MSFRDPLLYHNNTCSKQVIAGKTDRKKLTYGIEQMKFEDIFEVIEKDTI